MSNEFKLPELGENVESAQVVKVLVSEGKRIQREQSVVEIETDKAATEVPSDREGTIDKVYVKPGDEITVGQALFAWKDDSDTSPSGRRAAEKDETAQEEAGQASENTGKPPKDLPRQSADKTEQKNVGRGKDATERNAKTDTRKESKREKKAEPKKPPSEDPAPAAPSVRRFAREIGVDIRNVHGTGSHSRISMEDIKTYARTRTGKERPSRSEEDLPDFSAWGEVKREPMSKVRRVTAERMSRAWSIVPQAIQFGKADITDIEKIRQQYKTKAEQAGGHLSLTVVLVKTVAAALKHFPRFNASVDSNHEEIVYKKYFHIGLAMDTKRGLMVPVLRDVERKNILELSVELKEITSKALDGKLTVNDMRGGNITITNAGALGGDTFVPIVNWPEVAILGVAQSRIEAVFLNGEFKPRTLLPLSLSYDHRVIDGADAVRFLRWIVEALEDPVRLAWEG